MEHNYHTPSEPLQLREYGRNIQNMVAYCKELADREERTALAHEIVRIMGNIHPSVKENPEYERVLWDHFYFLAGYDIDIDSDFEMGEPQEQMVSRPEEVMEYSNHKSRFRQYGHNVEMMVKEALEMEDEDRKFALVNLVANIMKMQLRSNDRDSTNELTVLEHLKVMTKGELTYQPEDITWFKTAPPQPQNQQGRNQGRSGGKGKNRKKKYRK